jgi:dTDP-4-amino-4,6-dideoxygalactose transaminase
MAIQLFVPHFEVDECLAEIKECLEKGWTGLGYKTVQFEDKWKEYTDMPFAHYLNSATVGLHLAVKIFKMEENWQDGDEIISTPMTFVSSNHAIAYENLKSICGVRWQYRKISRNR